MTGASGNGPVAEHDAAGELTCRVAGAIDEVPAAEWDALAGGHDPFTTHAFLAALERTGCVGAGEGWQPQHLLVYDSHTLVGACPTYLKSHSYGEFVFDWGWADAYERHGLAYYPKLLSAVPFTPCTGPRLLSAPRADPARVARGLVSAAVQLAEQTELSSAHWLFTDERDTVLLEGLPLLRRWGCQFHWHNPGFRDMQDYLDAFTSKRRKQVRKERREAAAAPVEVQLKHGDELEEAEIAEYHALYCATYDRKWGYPSLTLEFFLHAAERMPRSLILILAKRGGRSVAGAHLFRGTTTLYGRNWGCRERHRSLHFEVCYYRGIEYCIAEGLARFEAGAQGEHKLTRGFVPQRTHSFHWIRDPRFRDAIDEFVTRERTQTRAYIEEAAAHAPFHGLRPGVHG
jgi:predicted N-acyltransferase